LTTAEVSPQPAPVNKVPHRPSLIVQTAQWLREAVAAGQWREFLPGERALSAQLQVSRPTLRAALEQLRREGRLEVVHGRPTRITRPGSVRPAARQVIAMLSPLPLRAAPPFVVCWVDELRERLARAGWPLEYHVHPAAYRTRPEKALERLVRRTAAAAWLVYLSTGEMQRWFAGQGVPCVVAGSCFSGIELPSVDIDNRATCRHAAARLLVKGHRRIALLLPAGGFAGDAESERGFLEAFPPHRAGKATPLVLRHDGSSPGICRQLDDALASSASPTAILVARSNFVLTVLGHLARHRLRVPEDVAVVCRDDDTFLEFVVPSVARYVSDPAAFARQVGRALLAQAQGGQPRTTRLMPRFVTGDSIG
jgi:LacI family transcriptional regulator